MGGRFRGLTNNGGSRGNEGRWLRQLYHLHGITPPADLGTQHHSQNQNRQGGRRKSRIRRKRMQISPGVERLDPE